MINLSYYEQYPIYEPAEGGYYYAGTELIYTERLSKRQAKKKMKELIEESKDDFEKWDYNEYYKELRCRGRYIGEDKFYVLEKRAGERERGRVPYC